MKTWIHIDFSKKLFILDNSGSYICFKYPKEIGNKI